MRLEPSFRYALYAAFAVLFVSGAGLDKLLGQACATAIVTVITFLVNRSWTFRMHPPPPVAPRPSVGGDS